MEGGSQKRCPRREFQTRCLEPAENNRDGFSWFFHKWIMLNLLCVCKCIMCRLAKACVGWATVAGWSLVRRPSTCEVSLMSNQHVQNDEVMYHSTTQIQIFIILEAFVHLCPLSIPLSPIPPYPPACTSRDGPNKKSAAEAGPQFEKHFLILNQSGVLSESIFTATSCQAWLG